MSDISIIPIFKMLFIKYIEKSNAPLEINISAMVRLNLFTHYEQMMKNNDISIDDWYSLLEDLMIAGNEVYQLLQQSHSRYKYGHNLITDFSSMDESSLTWVKRLNIFGAGSSRSTIITN